MKFECTVCKADPKVFSVILGVGLLFGCGQKEIPRPAPPPAPPSPPARSAAGPAVEGPEDPVKIRHAKTETQKVGNSIKICSYNIQNLTDGQDDGYYRTKTVSERR